MHFRRRNTTTNQRHNSNLDVIPDHKEEKARSRTARRDRKSPEPSGQTTQPSISESPTQFADGNRKGNMDPTANLRQPGVRKLPRELGGNSTHVTVGPPPVRVLSHPIPPKVNLPHENRTPRPRNQQTVSPTKRPCSIKQ